MRIKENRTNCDKQSGSFYHKSRKKEREQMKVRPMEASDSRYAIALLSWPETRTWD